MDSADFLEEPFGISGNVRGGASSSLRRSQKCIRASTGAEIIDEYSGIEVNAHLYGPEMGNKCFRRDNLEHLSGRQGLQPCVPGNKEVAFDGATEDENVIGVGQAIS